MHTTAAMSNTTRCHPWAFRLTMNAAAAPRANTTLKTEIAFGRMRAHQLKVRLLDRVLCRVVRDGQRGVGVKIKIHGQWQMVNGERYRC